MKRQVVLIGMGVMGKRHKECLLKKGFEIVQELDSYESVATFFQGNENGFLERKILFIASPANTHFEYAKRGFLKGFDVFVEKPVALNVTEVEELEQLAIQQKRILFPGHSEHYHAGFSVLEKAFNDFKEGKISFFRHNTYSKRGRDVSVALDLMVHDLEMFFALTKSKDYEILSCRVFSDDAIELEICCGAWVGYFSVDRNARTLRREILLEKGLKQEKIFFADCNEFDALEKEHEVFFSKKYDDLKEEMFSAKLAVEIASKMVSA